MNCLSLNIRGIGEDHKVAWVRRLKIQNRSSFIGNQETQLVDINALNAEGCWDQTEFGHVAIQSSGRSGGLLHLWDTRLYNVEDVIRAKHYMITIGTWVDIPGHTIIANVYGPHSPQEKKMLWEELIQIKNQKAGTWIILGDFNTVRTREERYNSQFCSSSAFWFNRFIDKAGLIDIRMGGHRYMSHPQIDRRKHLRAKTSCQYHNTFTNRINMANNSLH